MAINRNLPVPGLTHHKVTLSADLKTVLFVGVEIPTEHFITVTVPGLLGFYAAGSASANSLLSELNVNGFDLGRFGKHRDAWAYAIQSDREELARREREAREHNERMAAIRATPEEIAKAVAERKAREADLAARFGERGKSAAFGAL